MVGYSIVNILRVFDYDIGYQNERILLLFCSFHGFGTGFNRYRISKLFHYANMWSVDMIDYSCFC